MGTKLLPNLYIPIFSTFMWHHNVDKTFIKSIYSKFLLKIVANQVYGNKLSGTTDTKHSLFQKTGNWPTEFIFLNYKQC